MLELKNIKKSFGGTEVLKNVGLSVAKGDVVAILGPSGSGKTTLLRIANFLETADGGEMNFEGEVLDLPKVSHRDAARIRCKTGFVFQNYALFPHMPIFENVAYGLRIRGLSGDALASKVREGLAMVGLGNAEQRYPNQLSGGEQQRIAIARVMLKNAPVLILDEATSALDNESEILVGQSLEKLAHGRTTLTIAHRLTTIKDYDRILVLGAEGIEESGTHDELLAKKGVYYRLWNQLPGEDTL